MQNIIQELESKIIQARNDYYNGQAIVSDAEFDAWYDELKTLDPDNKAITEVGAEPINSSPWKKATHKIDMGSLEKVNTPDELKAWCDKVRDPIIQEALFVSEKLDGISIELVYENGKLIEAITRGTGIEGEAITSNVVKMGGVVKKLPKSTFTGSFRGEIILTKTNHQKHFKGSPNPRNMASGVSKRLDGEGAEHLDVILYQVLGNEEMSVEEEQFKFLKKMGCKTPNYYLCTTPDSVVKIWQEYQDSIREGLDYDIDGLVVRINDLAKQKKLGSKDMRPRGAKAFKFANEAKETVVNDVVFQTGNTGRITGVAILEPVVVSGVTVERASLYNMAYINKLGIGIGAKVLVVRANDVIPRVEAVIEAPKEVIKAPEVCPVCEAAVNINGEYLECPDWYCFARITGRIKNYVADLNILELGDTLIDRLVESGLVDDVPDLYRLSISHLANLERMGDASASNVYNSIWERNPVSLDVLLGALSIPLVGSSTIRLLMGAGYDTLDKILALSQSDMETVRGLGPARAKSLVDGLQHNKEMIMDMLENGLEIEAKKEKATGKLTGKSFVITGTLSVKREAIVEMIENEGGEVRGSVSKGTTYLIIADPNSTSTKANKARALGTTLIGEDEFMEMVGA